MNPEEQIDYDRPVAYDPQGRPLYYRPTQQQAPTPISAPAPEPETMPPQVNRVDEQPSEDVQPIPNQEPLVESYDAPPISTKKLPPIPEEVQARHRESAQLYPSLDLAPSEYVVIRLRRHIVGIVQIWLVTFAIFVALLLCTVLITSTITFDSGTKAFIAIVGLIMAVLTFIFGALATRVYQMNKFFVTNERVINHIQRTLFSMRKQSIGLDGVEDVSYRQNGIFQTMLNYGAIRLATVGDETTYRFNFVENPVAQIATINKTIQEYDRRRGSRRRR